MVGRGEWTELSLNVNGWRDRGKKIMNFRLPTDEYITQHSTFCHLFDPIY